jgi:hypothetical protein
MSYNVEGEETANDGLVGNGHGLFLNIVLVFVWKYWGK